MKADFADDKIFFDKIDKINKIRGQRQNFSFLIFHFSFFISHFSFFILLQDLLSLVFFDGCVSCGNTLAKGESQICLTCLSQLEPTHFHLKAKDNDLYFRFAGKVPVAGASSLFYFDKKGRFEKMIHAFKYKDMPEIGHFLGEFFGETLKKSSFLDGIEAILPVPLHPRKELLRGYNQSEKIAAGLQAACNIPVQSHLLKRVRKTETQALKSKTERWNNVADAFAPDQKPPKGVLIVDDVITTGSTIEACIRALMAQEFPPEIIKIGSIGIRRGK